MKSASTPQLSLKKGGARTEDLPPAGPQRRRPAAGLLAVFYDLELTVEQELAMLRVRARLRRLRAAQQAARQVGASALITGLKRGAFDREALYALTDENAEHKKQAQRAEVDAFVELFELLNPPQQAQLAARMEAGALRMQATQDLLEAAA